MWPSALTLVMTLTLSFQGQIWDLPYLSQKWSNCHEIKKANMSIELKTSMAVEFDLDHDLERWGLRIYRIVTVVTSNGNMPSTRQVDNRQCCQCLNLPNKWTHMWLEIMMTSSNGNIFRVTGHLCGEFTGPRWIPHTMASDAELWCLLWYAPE